MTAPAAEPERIRVTEAETAILIRETGKPGSNRVVPLGFGPSGAWLVPGADGKYPRWIIVRLAWLRGHWQDGYAVDDAERAEVAAFAAAHPRPAAGEAA